MSTVLNEKRIICVAAIIFCLTLAFMFATSQNIILGSFFGFLSCLGIDGLICSYNKNDKK